VETIPGISLGKQGSRLLRIQEKAKAIITEKSLFLWPFGLNYFDTNNALPPIL
jgi:hypothetical protein